MVSTKYRFMALAIITVMVSVAALTIVGCGETDSGGSITIGSGDFSEPWILAEISKILIEEHTDISVTHTRNITGSTLLHEGMQSGDFDLYPSWTGTQFAGVLEMEITEEWRDREKIYDYVKEQFDQEYDVHWFPPLGFDNTYALVVREDYAEEHGLETVSDIVPMADEVEVAMDATFYDRPGDGWVDFQAHYDMEFARGHSMDYGLLYRAAAEGDVEAAIAYSTDGRIASLGLTILEDDLGFFPPYDGAMVARNETLAEHPEIEEALSVMWGAFPEEVMAGLNAEVDVEDRDFEDVAREFVEEMGWID